MTIVRGVSAAFACLFVLPVLLGLGWWSLGDHPASWRNASWSSAGLLPPPERGQAAIYVLAARTGGLKGALSVHSWLILKRPDQDRYERYDKVGWGMPIRRDQYEADGYWYSNPPFIVHAVTGSDAIAMLPQFDAAIAAYPYREMGAYRIWPGPNSNSFVAYVLNAVPGFGGRLPPNAVGKDYAPGWGTFGLTPDGRDFRASLGGYAGVTVGTASGIEVNLLGLAAGIDFERLGIKLPAVGTLALR
ncbi:DUF3750 domain-containing protein [Aureimonas frigidaquae]|uniref:DUF3750 domain-containing protein n=1 Tax=Aureimonas frigidaquae TaxID=424757 RepID=UPI000782193E|nr:DUF3750 domain-containing protein [Aureimonas frigidaquae]